ncbi:hypothetical protein DM01DRAFT_1000151 [Hesseltinella vesiculosa]|uniref:Uncharacterized protein n=1 Tax=Hesseltinella vesiculosa TaxID=101127 RepID=A0A1X2GWY1_9FUNG|nr:hypothetical protein DM01DRAFT_1000151 [Hesseltinella vesiculosa]
MTANTRLKAAIAEEHPNWVAPRECQEQATRQGMLLAIAAGIVALPLGRKAGLDKNKALFAALGKYLATLKEKIPFVFTLFFYIGLSGITGYASSKIIFETCRSVT